VETGMRCITFDRRGHGRSDEPGHGYDIDTLADDLRAVLAGLDLRDVTLVVNRRYDILLANEAAIRLLSFFAPTWRGKRNTALMLLSHDGLRPAIANWSEVTSILVHHLRAELSAIRARDRADEEMLERAVAAQSELGEIEAAAESATRPRILIPVQLRRGDVALDLFTTITTLGTPLDITLQELRIESFFPVDARSRDALEIVMRAAAD
jgi:pimeloyl-ACP methyl ester carboxylesterase